MTTRAAKLQRWIDLLAELLARNYPISFENLTARIPAYRAAPTHEARRRMFERDKDELKAFGVPLTGRADEESACAQIFALATGTLPPRAGSSAVGPLGSSG